MKDEEEKLEIKKKPQQVKKEELDKVSGAGCPGPFKYVICGSSSDKC